MVEKFQDWLRMSKILEKLVLPKLRFPEFFNLDGWDIKTLGEITIKVDRRNKENKNLPVYSINNKVGFVPQSDQFVGMDSNKRGYDISLYKVVDRNTFAYNPARINVGSIGYSGELSNVIISSLYVCFKTNEHVHDKFLQYFFETSYFEKSVNENAEGGIRSYLFYDNLSRIPMPLPKQNEQQKVADCLSSLDDLISVQSEKVAALKNHKRGLLQQLFPQKGEFVPRLRFSTFQNIGVWHETRLGQVVEIASGQVDPTQPPYCNLPHVGGENIESITGTIRDVKTASELQLISGKYSFDANDVLYSKIRPALNKVAAPNFNGICSADIYPIRPVNGELRRDYLVYLLVSETFLEYAIRHSDRSKIPKINRDALLAYMVLVPPPDEQRRIAECLSSLDNFITAQSERLAALLAHKKGLLQQLFPSLMEGTDE